MNKPLAHSGLNRVIPLQELLTENMDLASTWSLPISFEPLEYSEAIGLASDGLTRDPPFVAFAALLRQKHLHPCQTLTTRSLCVKKSRIPLPPEVNMFSLLKARCFGADEKGESVNTLEFFMGDLCSIRYMSCTTSLLGVLRKSSMSMRSIWNEKTLRRSHWSGFWRPFWGC